MNTLSKQTLPDIIYGVLCFTVGLSFPFMNTFEAIVFGILLGVMTNLKTKLN